MKLFINDLKNLIKNHWKPILVSILAIWLITNYTDIKSGIVDGWNSK